MIVYKRIKTHRFLLFHKENQQDSYGKDQVNFTSQYHSSIDMVLEYRSHQLIDEYLFLYPY